MKTSRVIGLLSVFVLGVGGCGTSGLGLPFATPYTASLSGAKEVPPVATAAIGDVVLFHSSAAQTVDIEVTATGLVIANLTAMHIHLGAAGVNGPVIVNLSGFAFMDIGGGMIRAQGLGIAFPAINEADLLAGNCYVNIHTAAHPAGEIRGQLTVGP